MRVNISKLHFKKKGVNVIHKIYIYIYIYIELKVATYPNKKIKKI